MATLLTALLVTGCADHGMEEALGTLERDRIVLKATANEIILTEPVPEGTQVTAGTLLVQLDNRRHLPPSCWPLPPGVSARPWIDAAPWIGQEAVETGPEQQKTPDECAPIWQSRCGAPKYTA